MVLEMNYCVENLIPSSNGLRSSLAIRNWTFTSTILVLNLRKAFFEIEVGLCVFGAAVDTSTKAEKCVPAAGLMSH